MKQKKNKNRGKSLSFDDSFSDGTLDQFLDTLREARKAASEETGEESDTHVENSPYNGSYDHIVRLIHHDENLIELYTKQPERFKKLFESSHIRNYLTKPYASDYDIYNLFNGFSTKRMKKKRTITTAISIGLLSAATAIATVTGVISLTIPIMVIANLSPMFLALLHSMGMMTLSFDNVKAERYIEKDIAKEYGSDLEHLEFIHNDNNVFMYDKKINRMHSVFVTSDGNFIIKQLK